MKKKIALACENCHNKNYYEKKSKTGERLVKSKFCKICNKHTMHKEEK